MKNNNFINPLQQIKIMEHEHTAIVVALMALLFFSSWLMGSGFTGLYLLDFEQNYCLDDTNCFPPEVCCAFYNGNGGVCDTAERCPAINRLTMELGGQTSVINDQVNDYHLQHPRSASMNIAFVILGLVLVILVVLGFTHIHPENRKKLVKKKTLKKKSKKKK